MRFAAVASLAFIGAVAAQNSTAGAATGCAAKRAICQTTPVNGASANQAQCASENAQCQGDCYAAYNTCRTTPVNGLSANQAQCVSEYATCLGENPVASTGGLISSFIPYSATASVSATASSASASTSAAATGGCAAKRATCQTTPVNGAPANQAQCASENAQCQGDCYAAYNTCRTTPVNGLSANQAQCVSEYATCLGENPVASTGGLISSFIPYSATASASAAAGNATWTTQVVTAYTTVCPAPTSGAYVTTINNQAYTISSQTTITVTNCPCTLTSSAPAKSTGGSVSSATSSKPAIYTGAAAHLGAGMGFLGAAAGAVMLL